MDPFGSSGGGPIDSVTSAPPSPAPRLVSLDAFRGLVILLMWLVNNAALGRLTPPALKHADWGAAITLADLVFPWFLFAVGVALPFSYASLQKRGGRYRDMARKASVRALGLVAMGCVVDSAVHGRLTLGLGVLQLIGLAALLGALGLGLTGLWRAVLGFGLLGLHTALMFGMAGSEGHTQTHNGIQMINQALMPYGLKGLPSALSTGGLVLLATLVGDAMRARPLPAGRLVVMGALGVAMGLGLHASVPMDKGIWTASYLLYTGGLGTLALLAFYALFDRSSFGATLSLPLRVLGMNAIVAYVLPILVKTLVMRPLGWDRAWPTALQEAYGMWTGGWLYTLGFMTTWSLVLGVFYWRRWFLKI